MKKYITRIFILFIAALSMQQILQMETRACDVAVITASASATGRPFIWKNRDHTDSYRHIIVYKAEVKSGVGGCFKLMGETKLNTTSSPATTCSGGANESGFAIANTTVYDSNDPLDVSNVNTNLVEKALEECRTLKEFETIAKNYTSYWSNSTISGNFGVIDAYGGAAIYEMWTDGHGTTLKYRKFNVNDGTLTDQSGGTAADNKYSSIETVGFDNRTNSFHTNGWKEITSDTPRELRASRLFNAMRLKDQLSPCNVMRYVSKDVCGDNPVGLNVFDRDNMSTPTDYFYDPEVYMNSGIKRIISNLWDSSNPDADLYSNPNYSGEMYTAYCISRYQTTMGLVIEGAATPEDAKLTTMWVALGEPSMSVFIPFFPYAHDVSPYATDNEHDNSGYYWDGVSATSSTKPTCFLNLLFDCVEANPFSSSYFSALNNIYKNISLYKNNGAGLTDYGSRSYGSSLVMDTTINYPKLLKVQAWSLPLEDIVFDGTDKYMSVLRANPSLITRDRLAGFSEYCCKFVYENYCTNVERQANSLSSQFTSWSHALPDDGLYPAVTSINPANGDSGLMGRIPVTVVFSEPVDQATINAGTFTVKNGSTAIEGSYDISSGTVIFTPDSALSNNSTYIVQLTTGIKDLSGKSMVSVYNSTFTTKDDISPTVSSISPAYGSVNQAVNTAISVLFSEDVYGTVDTGTFMLMKGSTVVTGSIAYDALSRIATFTPASTLDDNTFYTVVLSTGIKDLSGNSLVYYTSGFTTVAPADVIAPTVSSINPYYGGINPPVDTTITAVFSEDVYGTVNAGTFLLKNGSTLISGSVTYDALSRTATFKPAGTLSYSTTYTIELTSGIKDLAGNSLAYYTSGFTTAAPADVIAPAVSSINPSYGGINPPVDTAITVVFSEDVYGTVNTNTFMLMNGSTLISGSVKYDVLSRTATFTPAARLAYSTTYTVKLTSGIRDLSNNALTEYISYFTTAVQPDLVAPTVCSVVPSGGGVNSSVNSSVTVVFSEPVDASTVTADTFMLKNGTVKISGTVTNVSSLTAVFTPSGPLAYSTVYTVELTSGIKDLSGNTLAGYTSVFTTAAMADVTSPVVNSVTPAGGAADLPVNTTVIVVFSEPVDASSVTASTFMLKRGTVKVEGTITNTSSLTAVFTPSSQLAYSTTYTVELTSGIKDLSGNFLTSCTSTFTTAALVDVIVPAVISINPADGAVNPPVTSTITAKFSEPIDPQTVNEDTFMLMNGSVRIYGSVVYDSSLYIAVFTPDNALDNAVYTVVLSAGIKDVHGNNLAEDFSSTFTVLLNVASPAITAVNTGNGGAVFPVDGYITVQFSEAMNPGSINVGTFLVNNGNSPVQGTVFYDSATNTAFFMPDNPLDYYTAYTVDLTTGIKTAAGVSLTDDYKWDFTTISDGVMPAVAYINPADQVNQFPANGKVSVQFNKLMDPVSINSSSFKVSSSVVSSVSGSVVYDSANRIATFTPSGLLAYNTAYTVELTVNIKDVQGISIAGKKWTFTTAAPPDVTAPTVRSVDPADGVVNPPLSSAITVKFSEPIDEKTISESTFMLMYGGTSIAGSMKYNSSFNAVIFTPDSTPDKTGIYTVILTTGIKDLSGNSLASEFRSTFTILSNGTSPAITAVNTGDGGAIFPVDGYITVQFSEAMNPDSINTGNFIVFNEKTVVAGRVSYDSMNNTAIFMPYSALAYNTTYTVDLTNGISSASGGNLADDITWDFTTTTDGIVPTIVYYNPGDKEVESPVSGTISVKFNKIMDQAAINNNSLKVYSIYSSVTGSVKYDSLSNIASFTPESLLEYNTTYTVEMTADVKDLQGISIEGTKWTFTTESNITPVKNSSGGGCGCGSAAEAATSGSGSRPLLSGIFSLLGTMLFPLSLIWMHRKSRKKFIRLKY